MDRITKAALLFLLFGLFVLTGCMKIGPDTIDRDRYEYTDAISESWKRQMLLNVIKLRYADAPIFLDVSSIINQYALETELHGSLAWNAFLPEASQNVGARSRYSDRPTITYQPLSGEKFTRSLMTPIPPSSVLSLIQAGWRADAVSWLCIQAINGIHNRSGAGGRASTADPEFYRFMKLFREVQNSRAVGMRIHDTPEKKKSTVLFFRQEGIDQENKARAGEIRKMLGIDLEARELSVVYGALPQNDKEIAILTRSMLEILVELASHVDVPQTHVDEKRTFASITDENRPADFRFEVNIHSDLARPVDSFVTVQYRNHWFWIDDRDYQTKRAFSFLMFLFTLAETGAPERAPVLTIPTG
jgi:hypothetical protein